LKDAQTAVAKGSTSACHLEAEVEKLKVANNIQTNVRWKSYVMTI
jgi:hypothetical protein